MKRKAIYKRLVRRYVEGKASDREKEVFFHLLAEGRLDKYLHQEMEDRAIQALDEGPQSRPAPQSLPVPIPSFLRYTAAAVVAGALLLTALLWRGHTHREADSHIAAAQTYYKNEVPPGGNHAILTLSDGSTLVLDSTKKGILGIQGKTKLTKVNSGSLSYQAMAGNLPAAGDLPTDSDPSTAGGLSTVYYNTITTPAGGQYQVTLADGTRVWLNALSTLRYPTSFNGADRTVELTGEAYFDVVKHKSRPFHVLVSGVEVQVLGTRFNVNAYADERSLKATLVEGGVRLVKGNAALVLTPGQQGQAVASGGFTLVRETDLDEVLAWKNGYFSFDDADIQTVMRQLSRWYGIHVKYEGSPTQALFWGKMGRDLNLTQVLAGLDKSKVHFQLEGTTLTVLP